MFTFKYRVWRKAHGKIKWLFIQMQTSHKSQWRVFQKLWTAWSESKGGRGGGRVVKILGDGAGSKPHPFVSLVLESF